MNVLFVSAWWPYPTNNGSKLRIYNLLRQLARVYTVTLLSFFEPGEFAPEHLDHLRAFCREVQAIPSTQAHISKLQSLQGYLSPWPRSLVYTYSPQMAECLQTQISAGYGDVIIGSQLDSLRYLQNVADHVPTILEEVELTMYYDRVKFASSTAQRMRAQMTVSKLESALRTVFKHGTAATVVSDVEQAYLRRVAPQTALIDVIPNGVDTTLHAPIPSNPRPYSLIYPGSVTYKPNYEAVQYFVRSVLPLIRERAPQTTLAVTGFTGDADLSDLQAVPGVRFTGYLESIDAAISNSWATVVPLLSGGGTRLKILQSLALGTPVISTLKGTEGLNVQSGHDLIIADSAAEMAAAVCDLFEDSERRVALAAAGRQLVEQAYNWDVIGSHFIELVQQVTRTHGQQSATLNS
jgi:glycosyltransferase involved in cell wall biosynthesis